MWQELGGKGLKIVAPQPSAAPASSLVDEGLEAALARKQPKATKPRIFDGEKEANLIVIARSAPAAGRAMDAPPPRRPSRGVAHRRKGQRRHHRPDAKKALIAVAVGLRC